ncbi:uncharacterized protein LOC134186923 isoform X2 [Corticium candelabrum]|uniref:uncharacterized protein LOC134186923 isoform X2 n=1 Tax=Corticium candelabrum TaxID=121492 RepID=UPI002E257F28|nr:uncharacterized protein LOC134186923 isoform X2 [Corticium candelabrum]
MAFTRMFSFLSLCVVILNQPEINSASPSDDDQRHPVGQCSLSSIAKTYAKSGHLVVHKESSFVAYCLCGETSNTPITWTGNAVDNGRGSSQNVAFGRSKYKLPNVSKSDEGHLCCVQGEHSACLYLLVVDAPVVTLSDRSHVTCKNETSGKATNAVSIQCNVSSHVEQDLSQGFMEVYINDVGTVSYDQTPSNSTFKDQSGNSVYTKAFEFREEMRDGDVLDCRWIREDGKIVKSEVQPVANFPTCPVPTVFFTTTGASTVGSTNSTTAAMSSQNYAFIIIIIVSLIATIILFVLLLLAYCYVKKVENKVFKITAGWFQPMNDLQRTNPNENHREEESTTVHLRLSDDDEGLERSTNDATTQTSGHLPLSDSSPLGNCLNSICETETGSQPTSEILNETENNVNPGRNTSIDDLADKYKPAANCTDPQPLSTIDFQKSVLSELKTIRQQSEERLAMNDDRNERVAPAAPEERIQTAAYPMTNHDRPEQPAEVSLSSSANKMPTAAQIVAIALEADVLVKKEKLVALLDSDLFSTAIITVMEKEHRTEFQCTRAMLEMWCNEGQATCRTMIEALSKLKLTRIACKVFGKQLVENILR